MLKKMKVDKDICLECLAFEKENAKFLSGKDDDGDIGSDQGAIVVSLDSAELESLPTILIEKEKMAISYA